MKKNRIWLGLGIFVVSFFAYLAYYILTDAGYDCEDEFSDDYEDEFED